MKAVVLSALLLSSMANAADEPCRPIAGLKPGPSLRVALFDLSTSAGNGQRDRDMGRKLTEIVAGAPGAMLIALTGNQHSRITRGSARNRDFEPMGYVLKQPGSPRPRAFDEDSGQMMRLRQLE